MPPLSFARFFYSGLTLGLVALAGLPAASQTAPRHETLVAPTAADVRDAGVARRRALQAGSLVADVPFRSVGPTIMSGRIADVEGRPGDPSTFWVAYASGGLWKTTSGGATFTPHFDDGAVMTIGDIAVDWRDPEGDGETVWVGTGESNSSRSSYAGDGIYRSTDGGRTWTHLGLEGTHHIGRVLVHPTDPNTAWVAALGPLYSPDGERGVFRTTDGGGSWQLTLGTDGSTGAADLALDPRDPNTLYATTWTRDRRAWDFLEAGDGSLVWRSTDGGVMWTPLTTEGSGFPTGAGVGRIGVEVHPDQPGVVFAVVDNQNRRPTEPDDDSPGLTREALRTMTTAEFLAVAETELTAFLDRNGFPLSYTARSILEMVRDGRLQPTDLVDYLEDANLELFDTPVVGAELYRSDDDGTTWHRTHTGYIDDLVYSYGYYFGQVRVLPGREGAPDRLFLLGVPLVASDDGGATWRAVDGPHVHPDHHALWIDPENPRRVLNGNDGGLNVSYDAGSTWVRYTSPAVGQFYSVAVDDDRPYNVYGGLQDNGVWFGPSTYRASPGWLSDGQYPYRRLMGGDGMQVAVDPRTGRDGERTVYTGFQFGNYFRVDRASGDAERVTPEHTLGERPLRWNWQAPIALSRHNPDVLYLGSHRLHRSLDGAASWEGISPDLTGGGRPGDVPYGTLTTLSESPLHFGLLWTGSDDGRVHVTRDGGYAWTDVSAGLPEDLWVSRVEASHHTEARAYLALNGYRWDDFTAYLYATDDFGATWTRLGADLPAEPVNVVREDPRNADVLYVGTDHGLYVSLDRGATFMAFDGCTATGGADRTSTGPQLPATPVHDLAVQAREADLVVATHGRSLWIADVRLVQQLTPSLRAQALHVFPVDTSRADTRWGRTFGAWGTPFVPEVTVAYWSRTAGPAVVRVLDDDGRPVATFTDDARPGLNLAPYALTSDAPQEADATPAQDGRFYLRPGAYTVEVSYSGETAATPLVLTSAPPPPERNRKKYP